MKNRLLWKLLLVNIIPVIGVIILVIWLAIDQLAAKYFMALMNRYEISPTDIHQMFLSAIHHYLVWASLAALTLAFIISYILTRRVLQPLSQMTEITRQIAAGRFSDRVEITTTDEIGDLGIAFNSMADSLSRIELLRKNMVADVAHELRTPLTNLRGYLEALNDGVIPPSPQTFTMLLQEILRLVHLVENLQQLARADAARAYIHKEELLLPEEINHILQLNSCQLQQQDITVETRFAPEALYVLADRDKLLQALGNLIDNTAKYTPEGGSIQISTELSGPGTKVIFTNTGRQIDQDDLPYIFERFFRADRSRSRDAGGAGIGLAIVKELIEAHGGTVGAESTPDQTSIWFILP